MVFIEKVVENFELYPERMVLADNTNPTGINLRILDEISGKVYAYVKGKGLGKEDFIMICLPRGYQPIIAELGIWRAGAAFVLVEDNYAPERIEFIKKDCNCKLVIDSAVWEEIQTLEPMKGFEKTDEHDACFAVYTSGTTGNPKGVLHEYGNLDRMIQSVTLANGGKLAEPEDRFALVAPLNFVASLLIEVYGMYHGVFNYVVPYSIVKNPLAIGLFIVKNKITGTFLTPSYIRKMSKKPPMLKFCIIGSEPANGVYLEGLKIHNFYLMSESGFAVAHFEVNEKLEETPVGKSEFGHDIKLLNEAGEEVADGEEGEVCFENKYVRGYIGLDEETKRVFVDGTYHTGDLAKKDANGNMVICGRLNDMVKINGNRVEPGEIENVAKKVLGIDFAACRIIDDGNRVFICVYYTDKIKIDFEKTRKDMENYLPYYMLPSFFIHIDQVPLRPNGKMDRKALPAPDFSEYQDDYVAPRDEVETALCNAFAKVLKMQRVGIHDDFYQMGGDSLASMDVIVESHLNGLGATDIFRGHTPEKIAEIYKKNNKNALQGDPAEINAEQMKLPQPVTVEQNYMLDYQMFTPMSTMYNLTSVLKFDKDVMDMKLLTEAVNTAFQNHPAFMTTFYWNMDGEIEQRYTPELFKPVELEQISEEEFDKLKDTLVKPFKIVYSFKSLSDPSIKRELLFRARMFETEEAGYLFLDVHHTIFDGTSSKVLFADIINIYAGQDPIPDYYYYIIHARDRETESEYYLESKKYFDDLYEGKEWFKHPTTGIVDTSELKMEDNKAGEVFVDLDITTEQLEAMQDKFTLSPNAFFMTVALITTAVCEQKNNVMLSWIYNGRNDMTEMNSVGLLFRNLPVGLRLMKDATVVGLFNDVVKQINGGIEHSCYPYIEKDNRVIEDDYACVLYQDNLRNLEEVPGLLGEIEVDNPDVASQNIMDMEILNTPEGMKLMLDYQAGLYSAFDIKRYNYVFNTTVKALVDELAEHDDMPLKKLIKIILNKSNEGNFFKNFFLSWMKEE